MKKQILAIVFLMAAIVAGTNSAYAQTYKNTNTAVWAAPTCGGSEYSPTIGEEYNYTVQIENLNGYDGSGTYTWHVTQSTDLLAGAAVTPGTDFSWTGNTTDDVAIIWNPTSVGKVYYLVVEYSQEVSAAVSATCEINNIKVFPIVPINGFWLDINASLDGTTSPDPTATQLTGFEICAPDVYSATITTPAVPGNPLAAEVEYDFGVSTIWVIIHAEGYEGDFTGTLKISGVETNQLATIVTAGWSGTPDALGNGAYTATLTSETGGVDIPVQIQIAHKQHENITDQTIRVSIDGTYGASNEFNDLSDAGGSCTNEAADADWVDQTIAPRPEVTPVPPLQFVTPNPVLTD
ncbi:hypothetical protein [Gaoshiqia sediminis]|uniref:CARDB domain-containing protein n=1 Tax=Gaoshiqia sediminis TaxID=2986998 RepID=A0AA41YAA7_9BACT|nr:hypothetical protein [Gaoshiqia sediminis]MCW0484890.1 hypothetical protein [Gaoshiqia sediminis]